MSKKHPHPPSADAAPAAEAPPAAPEAAPAPAPADEPHPSPEVLHALPQDSLGAAVAGLV